MIINDHILSAYLDGELKAGEMDDVATQIEQSPELAKRVENMRLNDQALGQIYRHMDSKPMPEGIMSMLEKFPGAQGAQDNVTRLPHRKNPVWQMAMAASIMLFIGLGAGRYLMPTSPANNSADLILAQQTPGIIGPDHILFAVLEQQPSASPRTLVAHGGTVVTPAMTFRTADNIYCRQYRITNQTLSSENIACRTNNVWLVKLSLATAHSPQSEDGLYQTASHTDQPLVDSIINTLIEGEALSTYNEKEIMGNFWQNK